MRLVRNGRRGATVGLGVTWARHGPKSLLLRHSAHAAADLEVAQIHPDLFRRPSVAGGDDLTQTPRSATGAPRVGHKVPAPEQPASPLASAPKRPDPEAAPVGPQFGLLVDQPRAADHESLLADDRLCDLRLAVLGVILQGVPVDSGIALRRIALASVAKRIGMRSDRYATRIRPQT